MPPPFSLPTTSSTPLSPSFTSPTHSSLPHTATIHRHALRQALKVWKRTSPAQQPVQLPELVNTINAYLPYLFALDAGLSGKRIAGEEVVVVLEKEVGVEWKSVLGNGGINIPSVGGSGSSKDKDSSSTQSKESSSSGTITGRAGRIRLHSLDSELSFVLLTLALTHSLSARHSLRPLYDDSAPLPSPESRAASIARATRTLLDAHGVLTYLATRSSSSSPPSVPDIHPSTLSGLAALALAEATLLAVLKDDPYPAALAETRSKTSTDWMFRAPSVSKVRANLFARLCLGAADHARRAVGLLESVGSGGSGGRGRVDEDIRKYADDVRRTARARAARFLGIDAEAEGKTGIGIAWLHGARDELGSSSSSTSSNPSNPSTTTSSLSRLRTALRDAREDRRIAAQSTWGTDGGRREEARVVSMLLDSWTKQNDTLGAQLVPDAAPLLAGMPSGREFHAPGKWKQPVLGEEDVRRMREGGEREEGVGIGREEGDSEDEDESGNGGEVVGAFPGTGGEYGRYY